MYSYLEIALINAAMIVPLALVAEVSSRVLRRPALTHLLWVIILAKLLIPPLWQFPLIDREWLSAASRGVRPAVVTTVEASEQNPRVSPAVDDTRSVPKSKPRPRTLAEQRNRQPIQAVSPLTAISRYVRGESFRQLVLDILLMVWAVVAVVWFVVQGFRCVRFRWSLAQGSPAAPELQQFADQLANQLSLARSPTVWLMPGVMSPMLWGTGQSTLLIFPEQLLDRLSPEATGTLLTHELAHYRRRDHWVRIISLMATGLFWWHPVVWWARREIESVEEECCDALVVRASSAPPKRYAEAILEAVDFLAELQLRLPPLATGLGQVPFLRQRLTWIMRGSRRQDLGYFGQVLCILMMCTLPWQPTWLAAHSPTPIPMPIVPLVPVPSEMLPVPAPSAADSLPHDFADTGTRPSDVAVDEPVIPQRWAGFEVRSHSADGRFVVMGTKSSQILLDLESGREFDLSDFVIRAMAFSPNSNRFVTIGNDGFLRLWNVETCEVRQAWQIPGGPAKTVDISADGNWIATGGRDGMIRIWSFGNALPVRELARELAPVNCVRFSQNGILLAVATGDWMSTQSGRIALFNVGPWDEQISMNWNSPAAAVAFRADGESLASGDWQGRVARWSIATGELLGLTDGHKDLVAVAEFSPNGSPLAEIDVPDLQPEAAWSETESRDEFKWFFNSWPMKQPASRTAPQMTAPPMNGPQLQFR